MEGVECGEKGEGVGGGRGSGGSGRGRGSEGGEGGGSEGGSHWKRSTIIIIIPYDQNYNYIKNQIMMCYYNYIIITYSNLHNMDVSILKHN